MDLASASSAMGLGKVTGPPNGNSSHNLNAGMYDTNMAYLTGPTR